MRGVVEVCQGILKNENWLRDEIPDFGLNKSIGEGLTLNRTNWRGYQCDDILVGREDDSGGQPEGNHARGSHRKQRRTTR